MKPSSSTQVYSLISKKTCLDFIQLDFIAYSFATTLLLFVASCGQAPEETETLKPMEIAAVEWVRSVQQGGGQAEACIPSEYEEDFDHSDYFDFLDGKDFEFVVGDNEQFVSSLVTVALPVEMAILSDGEYPIYVYRANTGLYKQFMIDYNAKHFDTIFSEKLACYMVFNEPIHAE